VLYVSENVILASLSRDGQRAAYAIINELNVAALDDGPIMAPVLP
jgi:hypothetical protein